MSDNNLPVIKSKLPKTGTTIFTTMTALALKHNAINLSQGFPDYSGDELLSSLVCKAIRDGHNQYAPMQGIPGLREAIAGKIKLTYGIDIDPDKEITITAGATQALFTAISAIIREGDEVIIFTPAYDSYIPAVEINGGIPICVTLEPPDFSIQWDMVKKLINPRTRMIILNSPHNPATVTLKENDLNELAHLVERTDILILSDEVYEHVIFDGKEHQTILKHPALAARSFAVFSFGKTFHNTGWKIGYCIAPDYLTREFRKVHQFNVFSVNTPIQYALAEFLKDPRHYTGISDFYQAKRDLFYNGLKNSRFDPVLPEGTYFMLASYDAISDEPDVDFVKRMTVEYGVAAIPVSVFYRQPPRKSLIRFCFAKTDELLLKAIEKLCKI